MAAHARKVALQLPRATAARAPAPPGAGLPRAGATGPDGTRDRHCQLYRSDVSVVKCRLSIILLHSDIRDRLRPRTLIGHALTLSDGAVSLVMVLGFSFHDFGGINSNGEVGCLAAGAVGSREGRRVLPNGRKCLGLHEPPERRKETSSRTVCE